MNELFGNALGRVPGLLASLTSGRPDPRLSDQQNTDAGRQARLMAGLRMLAMSSAGRGEERQPLARILAMGVMDAQQGGAQARGNMVAQQAMEDPALTASLTPQQRAILAALPPEQRAQLLAQLATASQAGPYVVGNALVDATGRPIYQGPSDGKGPLDAFPPDFRAMIASQTAPGIDPDQYWSSLDAAGKQALLRQYEGFRQRTGQQMNINLSAEESEAMTRVDGDMYDSIQTAADTSEEQMNKLAVLDALLANGMRTGAVQNITMPVRALAASMGMDAGDLPEQELFRAIASGMALSARSEGMTGPMSDRDIMFLERMVPTLANTPQGNRLVVSIMQRIAQRRIERARLLDDHLADGGTLRAFRRVWRDHVRSNPMSFNDIIGQAQSAGLIPPGAIR